MHQSDAESQDLLRARYVLTSLGVETHFTPRGDALRGELDLSLHGLLRNPITEQAITQLCFRVLSDGSLHIDEPPALRGTGADVKRLISIERLVEQLAATLVDRVSKVEAICERLQRMGLDATLDGERVAGVVRVAMEPEGVATLEVDAAGLVARHLIPRSGDQTPLSLGDLRIDYDALVDRGDIEIALSSPVARALEQRSPESRGPARAAPTGQPPTLRELADHFGDAAFPRPGFAIGRRLSVEGEEVRFIALHRQESLFDAKLRSKDEILWEGGVELETMGPFEVWLAQVLGGDIHVEILDDEPGERADAAGSVAGLFAPLPDEIWMMDVRIEDDDGFEVRYLAVNVSGMTFGAPRVLSKPAFEAAYLPVDGGYRMLVRVLEVGDAKVVYQRLDAERNAVGSPKQSPLVAFLGNFAAESKAAG